EPAEEGALEGATDLRIVARGAGEEVGVGPEPPGEDPAAPLEPTGAAFAGGAAVLAACCMAGRGAGVAGARGRAAPWAPACGGAAVLAACFMAAAGAALVAPRRRSDP